MDGLKQMQTTACLSVLDRKTSKASGQPWNGNQTQPERLDLHARSTTVGDVVRDHKKAITIFICDAEL